jgi:undecaprenyl diphosphate synthase
MSVIPQHVAIIMDGNGRWAQQKGQPRHFGHIEGVKRVEEVVRQAKISGVSVITLYAFSSENWQRPEYERKIIFGLAKTFIVRRIAELDSEKIRIKFIGERHRFPSSFQNLMSDVEYRSHEFTDFTVQVALSYGGRQEIAHATDSIIRQMLSGELPPQTVTPELLSQYLYTSGVPDPDLIIRTSGEIRTSNFLPWQSVYSEWIFRPELWPDFTAESFLECIAEYQKRERRMGKVLESKVV